MDDVFDEGRSSLGRFRTDRMKTISQTSCCAKDGRRKIASEICFCGASTKRNLGWFWSGVFYLSLSGGGYRQTAFTINYKNILRRKKKRKVKTSTEESVRRNEKIYMETNRNYYYSVVKTKRVFLFCGANYFTYLPHEIRTTRCNGGAQTLCTIFLRPTRHTHTRGDKKREAGQCLYMRDGHHRGATDEIHVVAVLRSSIRATTKLIFNIHVYKKERK